MKISEIIKKIRQEMMLTQAQLAKKAGVSQQAINKLEHGQAKRSRYLIAIANALNLDAADLEKGKITPKGEKDVLENHIPNLKSWLEVSERSEIKEEIGEYDLQIKKIPLLKITQINKWLSKSLDEETGRIDILCHKGINPRAFGIIRNNDSIVPVTHNKKALDPDEVMLIDPDILPNSGDIVILKKGDKIALRIILIDEFEKVALPLNPAYEKIIIDETYEIIGVVISKYVKLR